MTIKRMRDVLAVGLTLLILSLPMPAVPAPVKCGSVSLLFAGDAAGRYGEYVRGCEPDDRKVSLRPDLAIIPEGVGRRALSMRLSRERLDGNRVACDLLDVFSGARVRTCPGMDEA